MDPAVPSLENLTQAELNSYLSEEPIYVDYYPKDGLLPAEHTGDLPLSSFAYLGWDGKKRVMPSITRPLSFNYLKRGVHFTGVIDPLRREFSASELRNAGTSSQYVQVTTRGTFIEVENPDLGIVYLAFYRAPIPSSYAEPPASRAPQVFSQGTGVLIDNYQLMVIIFMLCLVVVMILSLWNTGPAFATKIRYDPSPLISLI